MRGTARLCDVEKRTVLTMLKMAGENCERLLTEKVRNVKVGQLQADEIWTFCKVKQGHLTPKHDERVMGDAYTFIALDRESKLVAWHLGKRDRINTEDFVSKIRWATAPGWFDMCTDGFEPYAGAIDSGLHDRANYSQVVKAYSKPEEGRERYSPGNFVTVEKTAVLGDPNLGWASTSHAHAVDLRVFQIVGQPAGRACATLRVLQSVQDSWITENHARHGGWRCGSRLDTGRTGVHDVKQKRGISNGTQMWCL